MTNISYRFFDRSFENSSGAYISKANNSVPLLEIARNRENVTQAMEANGLAIVRQIHSDIVRLVEKPVMIDEELEGDAIITQAPALAIGVYTADCVPVLLFDNEAKIIAAVHCGWKSAKADIIYKTTKKMQTLGATNIQAIIGPAIQQNSYEVSEEYARGFIDDEPENMAYFTLSREGHYFFDLPEYVVGKLHAMAISIAERSKDDTFSLKDRYFSYRRFCKIGDDYEGNLLSVIMLKS